MLISYYAENKEDIKINIQYFLKSRCNANLKRRKFLNNAIGTHRYNAKNSCFPNL